MVCGGGGGGASRVGSPRAVVHDADFANRLANTYNIPKTRVERKRKGPVWAATTCKPLHAEVGKDKV